MNLTKAEAELESALARQAAQSREDIEPRKTAAREMLLESRRKTI
jgi:hypothetical protein